MRHAQVLEEFASGLDKMAPEARAAVEAAVRDVMIDSKTSEILTFRTESGREFSPAASSDYAKALWCFMRRTPFDGEELESAVNERVEAAVQQALAGVLGQARTVQVMLEPAKTTGVRLEVDRATRAATHDELEWLRREFLAAADLPGGATTGSRAAMAAAHSANVFFHTAAGAAVLQAIATFASTAAGKVLIAKLLQGAALKIAGSAVLKTTLLSAAKGTGIAMLLKAALASGIGAAIGLDKLRNVPPQAVIVVLVGIIASVLAYEIHNMPKKLAKSLPSEVGAKIAEEWPQIAHAYAGALLHQTYVEVQAMPSPAGLSASSGSAPGPASGHAAASPSGATPRLLLGEPAPRSQEGGPRLILPGAAPKG